IGWRTKYILALSEDFLIHRWKLSGTMGLAHGFHFHKKTRHPSSSSQRAKGGAFNYHLPLLQANSQISRL
ncbi:hypothetical protein, partial [uncultured Trichococcus sp.]|uniref:hypothetical protein n=1 Tax=uncultured Trichococcus sp. TaxID=189665 RepID=UPI002599DD6A